ncbi:hypothetical protein DFQ28_006807 [Apophysomyces sp. BC1034]|nr:hypothetical protein DFQ30_006600 [Apophysomyces sp. BC1015]KAG0176884.1 hypothetical protein DFQ29_005493 [Apophysomyces sp. BC1021]KAG0187159.1 hypothetical protein DFQ28_006807 [Apophysomyces sp. BC1034]
MSEIAYRSQLPAPDSKPIPVELTEVSDKAVVQLLTKLDEGAQTIANLRSILTLKTAELNELLAQLELTNQVILNVESSTAQIESVLQEMGISDDPMRASMLINAEACLDSAIKSASSLCADSKSMGRPPSTTSSGSLGADHERRDRVSAGKYTSRIRYKPDPKHILRQLNNLLQYLELDSGKFFEAIGSTSSRTIGDVQTLQKAYVDLDLAKTIALSAKSNFKRRTILLRSRGRSSMEQVKTLGDKIRESETLWKTYTRNAPLNIDGKDILGVLDREDELIAKNLPVHPSRMSYDSASKRLSTTLSSSDNTRPAMTNSSSALSNDSSRSFTRATHSRRPSIQATDSSIPVAAPVARPTSIIPAASAITSSNVKKVYRHSAAARPNSVKVGTNTVGGPRARTSSLTASKINKETPPATKPALSMTKTKEPSPAASPIMTPIDTKKPMTKSSSQRGPGSTLRLRSMLAKRNQSIKPGEGA